MVEPEMAFAGLPELLALAEQYLTFIVKAVLEKHRGDLKVIGRDMAMLEKIEAPFPRLSYDDAHQMLVEAHAAGKVENLHVEARRFRLARRDLHFVAIRPAGDGASLPLRLSRPFYMAPDPEDPSKALCVDVLAPEGYGEIIGGSQRVDDYDLLKRRIEEHGLPLDAFQWYLDLRKYGVGATLRLWHGD